MNFLITGSKGVGKTYLVNQITKNIGQDVIGYSTLIDERMDTFSTYKMLNLYTNKTQLISKYCDGKIQGIEDTFETFGVNCLKDVLKDESKLVVLDELGRFEKNCKQFIKMLHKVLDQNRIVFAVLKKEKIDYLDQIKQRRDIVLFDLDIQSKEEVSTQIYNIIGENKDVKSNEEN